MSEYKTKKDVIKKLLELKNNDYTGILQYKFLLSVPDHLLTPDIITKALNQCPFAIQYLNQTEDICLEAVKINAESLMYIKNQTEKICLEAVKKSGRVLIWVKNQTDTICRIAIQKNPLYLEDVLNQTPEICLEAISIYDYEDTITPTVLTHVKIVDKKYLNNINDCKEQLRFMIKKKEIIMEQL